MKKYIEVSLAFVFLLLSASCADSKKIALPEAKSIAEIEILENTSEIGKKITDAEEISKIISQIKENTKDTGKESLNDQPANTEDYTIIRFHYKDREENPGAAYLYKHNNIAYIEQPYSGIWQLEKKIFDNIHSGLQE